MIVWKEMIMNFGTRSTSALLAAGTLLAAGVLTACSVSTSTGVSKSDLEANSLEMLQSQFPDKQVESITCSGGLDAKVGATTTCEIVDVTGSVPIAATVDDVTDGKVHWTFSDPQPAE